MIVGSLLLILVAVTLLVFGLAGGSSPLLIASIAASLLAAVALVIGARQAAGRAVVSDDTLLDPRADPGMEPDSRRYATVTGMNRAAADDDEHDLGLGRDDPDLGLGRDDPDLGPGGDDTDLDLDSPGHAPRMDADAREGGTDDADGRDLGVDGYGRDHGPERATGHHAESDVAAGRQDTVTFQAARDDLDGPPGDARGARDAEASAGGAFAPGQRVGDPDEVASAAGRRNGWTGSAARADGADGGGFPQGAVADVDPGLDRPADDDPPDEPAPQKVFPADAAQLARSTVEVLVVDGRPRYHLLGCPHLSGRESEPVPVAEAIDLGFTPCGRCRPVDRLAVATRPF